MTKNITAVLFALLLSTAAFAQYWGPHPFITRNPAGSSINEDVLEAQNATAAAFNGYSQANSIPDKAKTIAKLFYTFPTYAPVDDQGQPPSPFFERKQVPAVFVADENSENFYFVAFPAKALQNIPVDSFELLYSLTLINNGQRVSKAQRFNVKKEGCPDGMTWRKAKNQKEADICLLQQKFQTTYLKTQFQKLFKEKRVTQEMAARALKRK